MDLRNKLAAQFGLELPSTVIFDYPTVKGLAAFIQSRQGGSAAPESDVSGSSGSEDEAEAVQSSADVDAIRQDHIQDLTIRLP